MFSNSQNQTAFWVSIYVLENQTLFVLLKFCELFVCLFFL